MIKKTLLVFTALFVIYNIIVILNPKMSVTQQQWQDNVVKGEKYIYDESDSLTSVIIGSSLARRIVMDSLPHFYNLAFAGQGCFDGLEILAHKKNLPKTIYIEINTILTEPNKEFTTSLFAPLPFNIKKYFVSLRSDKQPLGFSFGIVQSVLNKNKNAENTDTNIPPEQENNIFKKVLGIQFKNYSQIPAGDTVPRLFSLLEKYVTDFKARGVKIVFFESTTVSLPVKTVSLKFPTAQIIIQPTACI
jgi:hypothetical protein